MKRNPFKLKSGNKSAFKELGSTPASSMSFQDLANKVKNDANRLHDNLQGVGESVKEFKKTRKDKVTDKAKASEDGLTNFERRRAEKKSRNPGESKFKADIRRKQEERKAAKANNTKTNRTSAAELNKPTDKEIKITTKRSVDPAASTKNSKITAPEAKAKLTFKQAFAAARKANKETFEWQGNPYTTKLKTDKKTDKKALKEHLKNVAADYIGSDAKELRAILDAAIKEYRKK